MADYYKVIPKFNWYIRALFLVVMGLIGIFIYDSISIGLVIAVSWFFLCFEMRGYKDD